MHYSTKFNAKFVLHTENVQLGELPLPYKLVHKKNIGDETRGGRKLKEHIFHYEVRKEHDGYIEEAIGELCDSLSRLNAEYCTALSNNSENWIVIGLLDSEFIEVHVDEELQAEMAKHRMNLSIENRIRQSDEHN